MKKHLYCVMILALSLLALSACNAQGVQQDQLENQSKSQSENYSDKSEQQGCVSQNFYTFSWPLNDSCLKPRGGTTTGTPIKLDKTPHPGWQAIREPGLSKFEQDRRAILAMAGPYRTSFDFLEVVGFESGYEPKAPYQSWGTEYVYVIEDRKDFISLQHIMVMFMVVDEKVVGPMVMKHWRQDWQYEKPSVLAFQGDRTWQVEKIPAAERKGTWAQAVYQVDDSPRYESFGVWNHLEDFSTWKSQLTWRPLPRREFSVRDDYDILEGYNKHTILISGWVHEQENLKRISADSNSPARYLAKELGVNRYERIIDHDFSAGDEYWKATHRYWSIVRETFTKIVNKDKKITLKKSVDGNPLFVPLFGYADKLADGEVFDESQAKDFVSETIESYLR